MIWVLSFTARGAAESLRLQEGLGAEGFACRCWSFRGHCGLPQSGPLSAWTGRAFREAEGVVFFGACGIAVRACAPFLRDKFTDPAVVVLDDRARFCVSLLSGHVGGANRLAERCARICGAVPVITTATDGNGCFAVDSWAVAHGLQILEKAAAKRISAALLGGETVGACTRFPKEYPLPEPLPAGLEAREGGPLGYCVTLDAEDQPYETTLRLVPRRAALGVGCRRGIEPARLERAVLSLMCAARLPLCAVRRVCSISVKAEEPALLAFCRKYGLPFSTYPAEELRQLPGEFSDSDFVARTVGVGNVCERAAVRGGRGALLVRKRAEDGVTLAAAWDCEGGEAG